jgi:hypothetical protein
MSDPRRLPVPLLGAIAQDPLPVRPLPSPSRRARVVVVVAGALLALTAAVLRVRGDAHELGLTLSWGATLLELATGLALTVVALRSSVPGRGPTTLRAAGLAGAAFAVQVAVGVATWAARGMPQETFPPRTMVCMGIEISLGLPVLLVTVALIARAWAVRPGLTGALAGVGAGILADGLQHLHCPLSDLQHVLVWHGGGMTLLVLFGWCAGVVIERRRDRRSLR